MENRKHLTLDLLYYLDHQLEKPVDELLDVKYPPTKKKYVSLDDQVKEEIEKLNELWRHRFEKIKTVQKKVKEVISVTEKWDSENPCNENLNPKTCTGLLKAVRKWKANEVLEKVYKKHGLKKRKVKKPTKRGQIEIEQNGSIVSEMFEARTFYREVVKELNSYFYRIEFI